MTQENNKPEEFVPEFNSADTNKTVKMKSEFDYSSVLPFDGKVTFIPKSDIVAPTTLVHPITDPDVPGCTIDFPNGSTLKFELPEFVRKQDDTNNEMIKRHFIDNDVNFMYPTPIALLPSSAETINRYGFDVLSMSEFLGNWIKDTDTVYKEASSCEGFAVPPLNRSTRKMLENACVNNHSIKRSDARAEIQRAHAKLVANWKKKGKQNTRRRASIVEVDFHFDHLSFSLNYKGKHALFFNLY